MKWFAFCPALCMGLAAGGQAVGQGQARVAGGDEDMPACVDLRGRGHVAEVYRELAVEALGESLPPEFELDSYDPSGRRFTFLSVATGEEREVPAGSLRVNVRRSTMSSNMAVQGPGAVLEENDLGPRQIVLPLDRLRMDEPGLLALEPEGCEAILSHGDDAILFEVERLSPSEKRDALVAEGRLVEYRMESFGGGGDAIGGFAGKGG